MTALYSPRRHCEDPVLDTGDAAIQKVLCWKGDVSAEKRYKHSMKQPAVYIMANKRNGTLYTGVTSNLPQRVYEHKSGVLGGFTAKHKCRNLVYYALFDDMEAAITEEKRIKGGSRKQKLALIESMNPDWMDLCEDITA